MMFTVVWRTVLVLLLMTAASRAQQTPDSSVSTAGEDLPVAEAEAGQNQDTGEAGADSGTIPQAEETGSKSGEIVPPDEYRASEQISDDLSVSFPVDI